MGRDSVNWTRRYRSIATGDSAMASPETKPTAPNAQASAIDWRTKIGPDPHRPGPDRWRLIEEGITVWAIIGHLQAVGDVDDAKQASEEAIAETAADYNISIEATRAALAHFEDHKCAIDTLLKINEVATYP